MNGKNLTPTVEVQYKFVEFYQNIGWENWATLTYYKDTWQSIYYGNF